MVPHDPSGLARSLLHDQRDLLRRYLQNALRTPERRCIRAANAKLATLLGATPAALLLLHAAGFAAMEHGGEACFVVPSGDSADARILAVLSALSVPSLLMLPEDLLARILVQLGAEDLSALQRTAREAVQLATASHLWLRLCPPRFWRAVRASGVPRFARTPGARRL